MFEKKTAYRHTACLWGSTDVLKQLGLFVKEFYCLTERVLVSEVGWEQIYPTNKTILILFATSS